MTGGKKSIIQFSCMSSRNHNQRFIDYSPGRARKRAEDGSTGLKELADEVNGEGGYVLDDNVSFQSTELFSDSSRVVCSFEALWTRYSTYTGRGGNRQQ
jgi:hypothetical protein